MTETFPLTIESIKKVSKWERSANREKYLDWLREQRQKDRQKHRKAQRKDYNDRLRKEKCQKKN